MAAVLLIPLGEGGGHVHLLDDVPPADAGVVGAEGDFAFLRGVGDDALFGTAEVVVEQVLEPHAGDEEEVPAVGTALLDVGHGAVAGHLAVVAAGGAEALVKLLEQVEQAEVRGSVEGLIVPEESQRNAHHRPELAAGRVVHLGDVLGEAVGVQESGNGPGFLGLFVDHQRHADAAVGVAAAGELAPVGVRSVDEVGPVGERGHEGDGEPVADGFAKTDLVLHVMGEVRKGVALSGAPLRGHLFVATGEGDGLEGEERDDLRVVEGEADDRADLLVVDAVDDGDDRDDVHAGVVQVGDRLQLHVEQVADETVRIGFVADAIELEIGVAEAGVGGLFAELGALGELDAVGGRLHGVVADLAGVADGVEEVGRQGGLATRELDRHLPAGLDADGVIEHRLDLFPAQFVDEANLVGVHEAGVAHHVAAVGEVDGEHRAAAVGDGGRTVIVQLLVVVGADIAAREHLFEVLREGRVDRHQVFELAVDGAFLDHEDLTVALDDVGLDFANLFVEENGDVFLAVENLLAKLRYALGAQRVGLARPAERGLGLFPALEQGLFGPLGGERRIRVDPVQTLEHLPGGVRGDRYGLLNVLNGLVHRGVKSPRRRIVLPMLKINPGFRNSQSFNTERGFRGLNGDLAG